MIVTFNAIPQVLFDGVVINQQLTSSEEPGGTRLTVTGEDLSVMMDLEEKSAEHPAQPETVIALKIIATYAQYGLIPTVIPPPSLDIPLPIERTPVQQGTDLQYLKQMAERYAYTFYVERRPGAGPEHGLLGAAGARRRAAARAQFRHGFRKQSDQHQL